MVFRSIFTLDQVFKSFVNEIHESCHEDSLLCLVYYGFSWFIYEAGLLDWSAVARSEIVCFSSTMCSPVDTLSEVLSFKATSHIISLKKTPSNVLRYLFCAATTGGRLI